MEQYTDVQLVLTLPLLAITSRIREVHFVIYQYIILDVTIQCKGVGF